MWSLDEFPRFMTVHDEEIPNVFRRGKGKKMDGAYF
jgi:hypothetical protein